MKMIEAFRSHLFDYFSENSNAIYIGEDVRNAHRSICTGLFKRYGPDRVIDMPISESAFTGISLGLAISRKSVFVEYNFAGLLYLALDQIFNQAHKYNEMMNTSLPLSITYILPTGTRGGLAGHHSDNPYALSAHLGIESYMPALSENVRSIFSLISSHPLHRCLYLPVACFFNEDKPLDSVYNSYGFSLISAGSSFNIITTGTSINNVKAAIHNLNINPNLFLLSDLSLCDSTRKSLASIPCLPTLFIDDSFIHSGIHHTLIASNPDIQWLPPVGRLSHNISFNESVEDSIVTSTSRIIDHINSFL